MFQRTEQLFIMNAFVLLALIVTGISSVLLSPVNTHGMFVHMKSHQDRASLHSESSSILANVIPVGKESKRAMEQRTVSENNEVIPTIFEYIAEPGTAVRIPTMNKMLSKQDRDGNRIKRYAHFYFSDGRRAKWLVNRLTWRITRRTNQISMSKQRDIMRHALAVWAAVVPLTFVEVGPGVHPDIEIRFERGAHGDGVADPHFDGQQNAAGDTLAHAFPGGVDRQGRAGDMHIDDANDWTDEQKLLGVAIHELGHTLGLSHSDDERAIMFAGYRDDVFQLSADDVRGAQILYGARPGATLPTIPPFIRRATTPRQHYTVRPEWVTAPPTEKPICSNFHIDFVFEDPSRPQGQMYFIMSDNSVAHISSSGSIRELSTVDRFFPQAPSNPDVVFSVRESNTVYFIKGGKVYHFVRRRLLSTSPQSIAHVGFPERPRFAYTSQGSGGDTQVYLFGRSKFWRYSVDNPQTARNVYQIQEFSRDLPTGVRFVTQWGQDNKLYAVASNSYMVLNQQRARTHPTAFKGMPSWLNPLCKVWQGRIPQIGSSATSHVTSLILLCTSVFLLLL